MSTVGNQEMVRITNQTLILNLIKEKGTISRADIAKILDLSPPSTSSNINLLLEMDLLREVGEGASSGGRKPILLEFNKDYGYIIGIDMGTEEVKISLGNICAEIVDSIRFKNDDQSTGVKLLIDMLVSSKALLDRNKIGRNKIKAIVIAVPGVYDKTSNKLMASRINWDDIDLVGALEKEYGVPVLVKNDAGAAALGEYYFGMKKNCSNMLYVNIDPGISTGIILNTELYEGSFKAAGIIRNMAFTKEQIGGIYKKNGYLETTISGDRLIQKVKNLCKNDKELQGYCGGHLENLDFGIIKRAYEKNHPVVKDELDKIVELIGMAIGNINAVLNVDTIILGGRMAALGEYLIISIKRIVSEICTFTPYICYGALKENSVIYGTLVIGQDYILKAVV